MNLIGNLPRLPQQQYLTLQFQELCQSLLITTKISVCCLIWKEARGNIELDGVRRRLQKRKKKEVSFLTSIVYNSGQTQKQKFLTVLEFQVLTLQLGQCNVDKPLHHLSLHEVWTFCRQRQTTSNPILPQASFQIRRQTDIFVDL